MAGKKEHPPIRTRSFVHMGEKLVDTRELTPEQKRRLADELQLGILRAVYPQVEFWTEESR